MDAATGDILDADVPEEKETYHQMKVTLTAVGIKNINTQSANRYAAPNLNWSTGDIEYWMDYANLVYSIKMGLSSESDVGKGLEVVAEDLPVTDTWTAMWNYIGVNKGAGINNKYKFKVGERRNLTKKKEDFIITYKDDDKVNLSFSSNLAKFDEPKWGSTMEWGYMYADDGKITINLEYDDVSKKFKYKSYEDAYFTENGLDRIYASYGESKCTLPYNTTEENAQRYKKYIRDFELAEGQTNELHIVLNGRDGAHTVIENGWSTLFANVGKCGNNPTGWNDDIEVIYGLKFEKLSDIEK